MTITGEQYQAFQARYDAYHAARLALCASPNVTTAAEAALLPLPLTHDETSSLEVYRFEHEPPMRKLVYIDRPGRKATTWTGEYLGTVIFGAAYRNNMGDVRVPIDLQARNGRRYYGVYFQSAGDYATVSQYRRQGA
jgi:hypothetical protein